MTQYDTYGSYDPYSTAGSVAGGLAAGALTFLLIMLIICLVIALIQIIANWKILSKAGKPGWGALIPIYGQYLVCKIIGVNPWWLLIVFLSSILSVIPILGSIASMVISVYFMIMLSVGLARAFGKEDSFAVGLILLSPVFYAILGLGKAQYVGPNPMKDIIFKNNNAGNNTTNNVNNTVNNNQYQNTMYNQNVAPVENQPQNVPPVMPQQPINNNTSGYCTNCGTMYDGSTSFCTNCGNQVK